MNRPMNRLKATVAAVALGIAILAAGCRGPEPEAVTAQNAPPGSILITGLVEEPFYLTPELYDWLPKDRLYNGWGGYFEGVSLKQLARRAKPDAAAEYIEPRHSDGAFGKDDPIGYELHELTQGGPGIWLLDGEFRVVYGCMHLHPIDELTIR